MTWNRSCARCGPKCLVKFRHTICQGRCQILPLSCCFAFKATCIKDSHLYKFHPRTGIALGKAGQSLGQKDLHLIPHWVENCAKKSGAVPLAWPCKQNKLDHTYLHNIFSFAQSRREPRSYFYSLNLRNSPSSLLLLLLLLLFHQALSPNFWEDLCEHNSFLKDEESWGFFYNAKFCIRHQIPC